MEKYFQWGYDKDPFVLFSYEHLITLAIILFICIGIIIFRKYLRKDNRAKILRYALIVMLVSSEISYQSWQIYYHEWSVSYSLPLHLSSVSLIYSIIMLLTKNKKIFAFVYFAGIGSALQAMITPVIDGYSFPHFRYIHFYVAHGGVVVACMYMLFVEKYIPTTKDLFRSFGYLNIYTLFIFIVNMFVAGNYMFVMHKPVTASILDFLGQWPWYFLSLEAIVLVSFFILFIPVLVYQNNKFKQN